MNILCIGYYDKHSRFFLAIKKELSNKGLYLNFKIGSIYLSGFLYNCFRFNLNYWLPFKAWLSVIKNKKKYLRIINSKDIYKNVPYKELFNFHVKLNNEIPKERLLIQTLAYLDLFDKYFAKNKPDIILLIGDSRLCIESCVALSKLNHIKTYYIEQGPFGSTILDPKGVNANASTRDFELKKNERVTEKQKKKVYDFLNSPKSIKYRRSPLYRGLDFIFDFSLSKTFIYPPDLKHTDTFPFITFPKRSKSSYLKVADKKTITYLLILQVPMDVNMIYHSPHFKNHYQILKAIYENLPQGSHLLIREHPLYKGKYEQNLYEYAQRNNIPFDNIPNLKASLDLARVVVINNSTVGIEAIALKKSVVVLGNSYYDNPKLCIKYTNNSNLKTILKEAVDFSPLENDINTFLYNFIESNLIKGSITGQKLIAAKTISQKIMSEFNMC
ncbi:hypothetical protein [Snuella lapsa]|uniref:Capsular biosynthesis protein n=1 Tax=Snuella lapsa TaxID=870481 RepID=A0ABP6XP47_9FLAO